MHFDRIFSFLGWLILPFAPLMLIPSLLAFLGGAAGEGWAFLLAALMTAFCVGALILIRGGAPADLSRRDICLIFALFWPLAALFAAAPFALSLNLSVLEAWFEAISALTTTGASLIADSPSAPRSDAILIWQALLHGAGGYITIVMALSVLAPLEIGGMGLRRMPQIATERAAFARRFLQAARRIAPPYCVLIVLCFALLLLAGTDALPALCLALAAISTGGGAHLTQDLGAAAQIALALFLILGAMNFTQHGEALARKRIVWAKDPETRLFLALLIAAALGWALYFFAYGHGYAALLDGFLLSAALISTSGLGADRIADAPLPLMPVLLTVLIGGMTVSTAGGMKVLRVSLLFQRSRRELFRLSHPRGMIPARFAGTEIPISMMNGVWTIFTLTVFAALFLCVFLTALGTDFIAALVIAICLLANAGLVPALLLPDFASYGVFSSPALVALMAAMVAGRVEMILFFSLLTRSFWRD